MSIDFWMSLWTWIYVLGLGAFFVIALAMVPLGARDVVRLLRAIQVGREEDS